MIPDKDLLLGGFYMTKIKPGTAGSGKIFSDTGEAILAYQSEIVHLRAPIKVRISGKIIETCVGRILINDLLPEEMRFRNEVLDKAKVRSLVRDCYSRFGGDRCAQLLDDLKKVGFHYATHSGISWGMGDLKVPEVKSKLIKEAEAEIQEISDQSHQGLLTDYERYQRVIETWTGVVAKITAAVREEMDEFSTVYTIVTSGARASIS